VAEEALDGEQVAVGGVGGGGEAVAQAVQGPARRQDAGGELARNNVAVGAFLGAVSVSIGLLNAACLS